MLTARVHHSGFEKQNVTHYKISYRGNSHVVETLQQIVTLAMEPFLTQVLNSHDHELLSWEFFK